MTWRKDPLVHFLIFGAILFAGHSVWTAVTDRTDRQILVDTAEINRQAGLYAIENGRPPDETELNGIIVAFVEEAVLAREAERLGLGHDDTVIRRRLAQKMRLVADATPVGEPTDAQLMDWFSAPENDYGLPETRSVQHVFFSDEGRSDAAADAASPATEAALSDWQSVGDPFIVARQIGPISRAKLQQDYGQAFADAAFAAGSDDWSAPVRSPFGVHRLRILDISPAVSPAFEDVKAAVRADWLDQTRREASAQAILDMIGRYDVVVQE